MAFCVVLLCFLAAIEARHALPSQCNMSSNYIGCPYNTFNLTYEYGERSVYWQVPLGKPPVGGWPVVIFYQASLAFWAYADEPFGAYYQAHMVKNLLDRGYAVIAPAAGFGGYTFWDTNVPPYDFDWESSPDFFFLARMFSYMQNGTFGSLNFKRLYATGISSGGYMTSRMAISYRGMFRSLVIASGSYCTCSGFLCYVFTSDIPPDHPPTLFLHGLLDPVVPITTMYLYRDTLLDQNITTDAIISDLAVHEWIEQAPDAVYEWFNEHP